MIKQCLLIILLWLLEQNVINITNSHCILFVFFTTQVFFKTKTDIGRNGYVNLDAPHGFDFTSYCDQGDLPEKYYAYTGEGRLCEYYAKSTMLIVIRVWK
jgi:hypothetical protein